MRRRLLVLPEIVCACALAAPAPAADSTGYLSQIAGTGGCVTDDGKSNGAPDPDCANGRGLLGAQAVALSPDGRYAYVYSWTSGAIAILSRSTTTGALSQADDASACVAHTDVGGDCSDGHNPSEHADSAHAIALSGDHLFAAGVLNGVISVFSRDLISGGLTEASCISEAGKDADGLATCTTYGFIDSPQSVAVSPDGAFLYASGNGDPGLTAFSVSAGGTLAPLGNLKDCYRPVPVLNCTAARFTENIYDIALSPDGGSLYAVNHDADAVIAFARDASTGGLSPIGGPAGCVVNASVGDPMNPCTRVHGMNGPASVEVSPDGRFVTVGAWDNAGIAVLRRAPDGSLSQAGCVNEFSVDGCGPSRSTRGVYRTLFSPDSGTLIAAGYGEGDATTSGMSVFDVGVDGSLAQRAGTAGCVSDTGADTAGVAGSCTAARGVLGPVGIAMTQDGKHVYATGFSDGGLAGFRVLHHPACSDASATTAFGTAVTVPVTCTDADGDTVTLAGVDGPGHGGVSFGGLAATYTPATGFSGTDSFRVKGSDGSGDSAPATVSVTVGAAPPPSSKSTPKRLSLSAKPKRDRRLPFKFTFSGKLTPTAGAACSGKVTLTVKRGKKTVARKTTTLSSSCGWKATVTFKNRKKLGRTRTGKLTAKARFAGNAALYAKSSKAMAVRYG